MISAKPLQQCVRNIEECYMNGNGPFGSDRVAAYEAADAWDLATCALEVIGRYDHVDDTHKVFNLRRAAEQVLNGRERGRKP